MASIVRTTPKHLIFPYPPSSDVSVCTSVFRVENTAPNDQWVVFKVRTTAVSRYVVRPNIGIVLPGRPVQVSVVLNYDQVRESGVDLGTVQDRFQLVAAAVDASEQTEQLLLDVWQRTPEEKLVKIVIKSKFVAPNMVKTVSPEEMPDMEQAKQTFRQEMAASKSKKELKVLKEERDAAQKALMEKEKELVELTKELNELRTKVSNGGKTSVTSSSSSWVWWIAIWIIVVAAMFVFQLQRK